MQFFHLGTVSSIEVNHKPVDIARKGSEVCVKIEPTGGDAPKLFGRHFDYDDLLVSKVSVVSSSLNFCKNGNFNNFTKNIFANDPCGQHKRCGMAILSRILIL